MRPMNEQTAYDALLADRVKQLKEIEDRLDQLVRQTSQGQRTLMSVITAMAALRNDVKLMIADAEREHAEF